MTPRVSRLTLIKVHDGRLLWINTYKRKAVWNGINEKSDLGIKGEIIAQMKVKKLKAMNNDKILNKTFAEFASEDCYMKQINEELDKRLAEELMPKDAGVGREFKMKYEVLLACRKNDVKK